VTRKLATLIPTLTLLSVLGVLPNFLDAQQVPIPKIPPELTEDKYVRELLVILDRWDKKDLGLPKKSDLQKRFESELSKLVDRRLYPYQTSSWANERLMRWKQLPEIVNPERPLTEGARHILVLLFAKNRTTLEKEIPSDRLKETLDLPLFLVLGRAQQDAAKAGRPRIEIATLVGSLFDWWTQI
jgi:hypothetical protein